MKICLDSDIVIDLLRKKEYALLWLRQNEEHEIVISQVTLYELYNGAFAYIQSVQKLRQLELMLIQFNVLFTADIVYILGGKESARLEAEGQMVDTCDILIGVCARENNCVLKTNNTKHFSRIEGLQLV